MLGKLLQLHGFLRPGLVVTRTRGRGPGKGEARVLGQLLPNLPQEAGMPHFRTPCSLHLVQPPLDLGVQGGGGGAAQGGGLQLRLLPANHDVRLVELLLEGPQTGLQLAGQGFPLWVGWWSSWWSGVPPWCSERRVGGW